jgi:hypothetical protein
VERSKNLYICICIYIYINLLCYARASYGSGFRRDFVWCNDAVGCSLYQVGTEVNCVNL